MDILRRVVAAVDRWVWASKDARYLADGWTIKRTGRLGLSRQYSHPRAAGPPRRS